MTTSSHSATAPLLNSNLNQVQPNAWDELGQCAIVKELEVKLATAGPDEQQRIMRRLVNKISQANQEKLRELKDKTEQRKEAHAHKEHAKAKYSEELQEAKRVRADGMAKLDEDYATVTVVIRRKVEADKAVIAELDDEVEELHKELHDRISWGLPEEDVNMIMSPDMPKVGQKPVVKPTWASKVVGMAAAMEEGAAKETDVPMSAQEHRELEKAIRPKKVRVPEVYEPPQRKKRMLSEDEQRQALEKFGDQPEWAEAGGLTIIALNKVKGTFSGSFKDICMDLINHLEHLELHVHNISRVTDTTVEVLVPSEYYSDICWRASDKGRIVATKTPCYNAPGTNASQTPRPATTLKRWREEATRARRPEVREYYEEMLRRHGQRLTDEAKADWYKPIRPTRPMYEGPGWDNQATSPPEHAFVQAPSTQKCTCSEISTTYSKPADKKCLNTSNSFELLSDDEDDGKIDDDENDINMDEEANNTNSQGPSGARANY
ncbi:hypothetical protein H4S07_001684 [Coemansia furcata]|uniref:Uncharacterized protein n=1 Tax=Coemansia furcata TaxID=417177 RepID=A0ACC1LNT6_9FUNG|nr:hypothetical protein H4S07_001684 [Coemansia furcata]